MTTEKFNEMVNDVFDRLQLQDFDIKEACAEAESRCIPNDTIDSIKSEIDDWFDENGDEDDERDDIDAEEVFWKLVDIHYKKVEDEQKEADARMMMIGINKFLFCNWNFPSKDYVYKDMFGQQQRKYLPRFIMETEWTCSVDHIIEKWECGSNNSDAYFPRLYAELSNDNRIAFMRWIIKNYNTEQKLSF